MEHIITDFINNYLLKHIVIISIMFGGVLIAMGLDLLFGWRKAAERGESHNSTALKKTATKAHKYYSPMLCLAVVDIMACFIIPLPVFTMLWGAYCVFCEFKSVKEKAWEKAEILRAAKTMNVVIENKDDLAKMVAQLLFEQNKAKED
ncbi:MAG: hypothetical protein ACRCUJ_07880 [Phocaeicola sp.]